MGRRGSGCVVGRAYFLAIAEVKSCIDINHSSSLGVWTGHAQARTTPYFSSACPCTFPAPSRTKSRPRRFFPRTPATTAGRWCWRSATSASPPSLVRFRKGGVGEKKSFGKQHAEPPTSNRGARFDIVVIEFFSRLVWLLEKQKGESPEWMA